jgi:Flp pilus assembly protein TadD
LTAREPVAFCLGGLASVLSRYDDAERNFEEATELNVRGGMKYAEAHTQLLWGRMLVARRLQGDLERAHRLLEHAYASARTNGYSMIEQKAAAALSASI